ncbi:MAG: AraC family transcriptional regulator [Planctomycetota bacterium]
MRTARRGATNQETPQPPADHNRLRVESARWSHGRFRLPVDAPDFGVAGAIARPTIVFPREPVRILHPDAEAIVADANTVMVYNAHQPYAREAISGRGDRCEWYSVSPAVALEIVRDLGMDAGDPQRPMPVTHVACPASLYAAQRRFADDIARGVEQSPDAPVAHDEHVFAMFRSVLGAARSPRQRRLSAAREPTRDAHRRLAEDAKELLATRLAERLTLDRLADDLDVSPYHLARVFRLWTGASIHAYLTRLRIAAAMDLIEQRASLTHAALRTGFSSHSHFTSTFRRMTGETPSRWRRRHGPT